MKVQLTIRVSIASIISLVISSNVVKSHLLSQSIEILSIERVSIEIILLKNFNTISNPEKPINKYKHPIVYLLNATSFVKPHSIESLRCDVFQIRPDIVIITESWPKSHHSDGLISIDGYSNFRKVRVKKCGGGGVLIQIKSNITANVFEPVYKINKTFIEKW